MNAPEHFLKTSQNHLHYLLCANHENTGVYSAAPQTPTEHTLRHDSLLWDITDVGQSNKKTKVATNVKQHHKQWLHDYKK